MITLNFFMMIRTIHSQHRDSLIEKQKNKKSTVQKVIYYTGSEETHTF